MGALNIQAIHKNMKFDDNYWPDLVAFGKKRLLKPVGHPSYWFYFWLVVVGLGGIGVWKAVFFDQKLQAVTSNLMTFFPAVAGSSAFEIVLSRDEEKIPKSARTATLLLAGIFVVAVIFIWHDDTRGIAAIVACLAALLSLALWWVANAENDSLLDSRPGKGAFGDEANAQTKGELGNLKG